MELDREHSRFMETEGIPRLLVRFAGPAMVGMIASALYNIVDRIFVGQTVGAEGIAAIALGFPCMLFFFAFALLLGVGGASRIALQLGAKDLEGAQRTLGNAVLLCLLGGGLSFAFAGLFVEPILRISGASVSLMPAAKEYLFIILWGVFFSIPGYAGSCYIRACGSPGYAMGTQLIGALANVVLDAWFVLGLHMGIKGAAIATVISQILAAAWVVAYFFLPHARLRLKRAFVLTPRWNVIRRILAVGFPPFLVELNFVLIHGLMNVSVAKYGGDLAVSATGIFMSMDSLLFMPAVAIGEGTQPIVGYNYGAGRYDRVRHAVRLAVTAASVFYVFSFLMIQLNAEFFVRLFNSSNEALIALAARAMRIANAGIPVMGVSIITSATLQGLGRAREGLILSFIRFGLLMLLPLLIFPRLWGVPGTWGCFPLSDIAGSVVAFLFLRRVMRNMEKRALA